MNESTNQSNSEKLLQPKQASALIQQLESRGDFRYRGIQGLYTVIQKWTEKYDVNGVLASFEQLTRDNRLPDEKVKEYIIELLGRGSSSIPVIVALQSLQYISGSNSRLEPMVVFCRPLDSEQNSYDKYYKSHLQKNNKAIISWLDTRKIQSKDKMQEQLTTAIKAGKLQFTRARAIIARHFLNEYDLTPEHKKKTNQDFVKPSLKGLLDLKKVILLKGISLDGTPFNALFFNDNTELERRSNVLVDYFNNHISTQKQGEDESETQYIENAIEAMRESYSSLGAGEQQVIQELQVLSSKVEKVKKDKEDSKQTEKLEHLVEMLHHADHVVDQSFFKDAEEGMVQSLYNVSGVLSAEFAVRITINSYYLHRDQISEAIKYARDLFDNSDDDSHVQILSAMGLEKYLDKDHYKAFLDLEERVLFNRLPVFVKIWRSLFGNKKLKQKEVVQIKTSITQEQADKKVKIRKAEVAKQRKKLVSKRMEKKSKDQSKDNTDNKSSNDTDFGKPDELTDEEKLANVKKMENAKEKMSKILHELDGAWDKNEFPNREFLLNQLSNEFTDENHLIMFLKKHAKKEIYSFKINVDKPEYMWPVLITRRYLKKKGKSLYNKYQEKADKQRKSSMPDQEKFDIVNSVEVFLGKILPKL